MMASGYIKIYEYNASEADFRGNGLAVLNTAFDVAETLSINGDRELTFQISGPKKAFVRNERIVVLNGQRYRIKSCDKGSITARAIYEDAAHERHIQYIEDMIGKSPRDIMVQLFKGTSVNVLPLQGLPDGMEWVTNLTDFFAQSKITPIGGLQTLMETLDRYKIHNELYVDNYNIALVRSIGVNRGARIDAAYNAKDIAVIRDSSELVTRLYPYGKDDLHIGSVNNDVQYIESPLLKDESGNPTGYPVREGYIEFSEIEDPKELLSAARFLFDENNPDRIDIPKYSVSAEYAERKEREIRLGDTVLMVDRDFGGIEKPRRVTSVELHPFEPNKNTVTVGTSVKPSSAVFDGVLDSVNRYEQSINAKGETKSQWLENLKGSYRTAINKALAEQALEQRPAVIHDYGDIWVNPDNPDQALAIVGGVIAMANGKTADGDWNWEAFGDWTGFTANKIVTGQLNTSDVEIISGDGKMSLKDNMLTMQDGDGTLRLKIGFTWSPIMGRDVYVYQLYDDNGDLAFTIGDDGFTRMKGALFESSDRQVYLDPEMFTSTLKNGDVAKQAGFFFYNTPEHYQMGMWDGSDNGGGLVFMLEPSTLIFGYNNYSFLKVTDAGVSPSGPWDFGAASIKVGTNTGKTGFLRDSNGKNIAYVKNGIITALYA